MHFTLHSFYFISSDCQKPNLDVLLAQYIKDRAVVEVKFSDGSSVTSNGSQIPLMMEQPPSQGGVNRIT